MTSEHIYTVFDRMLDRSAKEKQLQQKGAVLWLYGLSGSGKSTLAIALERRLAEEGFLTQILDGDNIRSGLNRNLGFSDDDRTENIRRISEVAKLFLNCGVVTITSFITPREDLRTLAVEIIGEEDFFDVYVQASFATCANRDPKGLYAKVQSGKVPNFTGVDSEFEEPANPALILNTEELSIEDCVEQLYAAILPKLKHP